ncbi:MAG: helix-turn-helix domain-containing protein [Dermatophilaceae bacterium]
MPHPPTPGTGDRTRLTLTDPRALRALAHPARQRVVAELYAGESLTATQAAALCDLTPSAMSYHLRALEKWGIVRRGESTDGRERPWLAAADDFTIPHATYAALGDGRGVELIALWGNEIARALARVAAAPGEEGADASAVMRTRLWVTPEEARAITDAISAAMQPAVGRTSRAHPEGARPMDAYVLLVPAETDAQEQPAVAD